MYFLKPPNQMYDQNNGEPIHLGSGQTKSYFLKPGEFIASREPAIITTVLGTCVAVCLHDPVAKVGGMNHFMLPYWNKKNEETAKYGDVAISRLVEAVIGKGATKSNLVAKVYGGSDRLNSTFSIGLKNIDVAIELLKKHKIKIIEKNVGGLIGRKLKFSTVSNETELFDLN